MNGSPLKTTTMAATGGLFGSQQCPEDDVGSSDDNGGYTSGKDTQFGPHANQFHPAPGYSYQLYGHHFQALPSSTTRLHSTWHQAHNQALVQPKDNLIMGHRGKHMISPKEDMVDLKCSPISNWQDMGGHLQPQLECLQHCLETIQSFGRPLPPPLHQDKFPAHLWDPPVGSERNEFSRLRNGAGQMLKW